MNFSGSALIGAGLFIKTSETNRNIVHCFQSPFFQFVSRNWWRFKSKNENKNKAQCSNRKFHHVLFWLLWLFYVCVLAQLVSFRLSFIDPCFYGISFGFPPFFYNNPLASFSCEEGDKHEIGDVIIKTKTKTNTAMLNQLGRSAILRSLCTSLYVRYEWSILFRL